MSNHFGDYRQLMRKEEERFPSMKPKIMLIKDPRSSCLFQRKKDRETSIRSGIIMQNKSCLVPSCNSFAFGFGPDSL